MVFRRRGMAFRPINSRKNVVDTSVVLGALTNTVVDTIVRGVDQADLATPDEVTTGSKVMSFYHSSFFIAEGGELASEVPLVDWYIIQNPGNVFGTTFDATNLPTPGATGIHVNKKYIIHEEKGLTGGGDVSLAGIPMIFKGVIRIPRGRQRVAVGDTILLCARSNFATKGCSKSIYKWYS